MRKNKKPGLKTCEACILAGGLSSRMGRQKAQLRLGGKTILHHIQRTVQEAGFSTRVLRRDLVERCGPLGGIYTALQTATAEQVLFLSCDMPFVTPSFLRQILAKMTPGIPGVFVRQNTFAGFPFVLLRTALPIIEHLIKVKEFSIQSLAKIVGAEFMDASLAAPKELFNINNHADLNKARAVWRERKRLSHQSQKRRKKLVLEVSNLSLRRGSTVILDEISWSVEQGRHWAIAGANGSGKTSLLSALTGYMTPSAGRIEVLGKRFGETDWRDLRRKIGLVSSSIRQMMAEDEPALSTVVSGKYAMIDFWGKATSSDLRRAKKILKQIECAHLAHRPWSVLSQGERQRILIGRALMARPPLLILDEPCAGLDPAAREHFLQFLQRLAAKKNSPALILVTHHVEEIMPLFTDVLILKNGRILASGRKETVLTSQILSDAFGAPVRLKKSQGRFSMRIAPSTRVII